MRARFRLGLERRGDPAPWEDPTWLQRAEELHLIYAEAADGRCIAHFLPGSSLEPMHTHPSQLDALLHAGLAMANAEELERRRSALRSSIQRDDVSIPRALWVLPAAFFAAILGPITGLLGQLGMNYEGWQASVVCAALAVVIVLPIGLLLDSARARRTL